MSVRSIKNNLNRSNSVVILKMATRFTLYYFTRSFKKLNYIVGLNSLKTQDKLYELNLNITSHLIKIVKLTQIVHRSLRCRYAKLWTLHRIEGGVLIAFHLALFSFTPLVLFWPNRLPLIEFICGFQLEIRLNNERART